MRGRGLEQAARSSFFPLLRGRIFLRALCSTRLSRPQNGQLYFCGACINLSPGKYFYRAADSAKLFSSRLNRRSFHFASPFATRLPEASERDGGRDGGRERGEPHFKALWPGTGIC